MSNTLERELGEGNLFGNKGATYFQKRKKKLKVRSLIRKKGKQQAMWGEEGSSRGGSVKGGIH